MTSPVAARRPRTRNGPSVRVGDVRIPTALLVLAAIGWWWSVRMASDMQASGAMGGMDAMGGSGVMSFGSFLVAWVAMMTAMMFPAIAPVVRLYVRAAAAGRVAPSPFFVAGYIVTWGSLGIPAYYAWRGLMDPIADAAPWAARLAGLVLVAAAIWQLTPLKSICLRHCRSPMSFFLHHGRSLGTPSSAVRAGTAHGLYCVGCCWALMAVLVAVGTMNLWWMLGLAVLILLEKTLPAGEQVALAAAVVFAGFGAALIAFPSTLTALT